MITLFVLLLLLLMLTLVVMELIAFEYHSLTTITKVQKDRLLKLFHYARSGYPELDNVDINLKFERTVYATMECRPSIKSLFVRQSNRTYVIHTNSDRVFKKYAIPLPNANDDEVIGWFAHELAHVLQFSHMTRLELLLTAIKFFNSSFKKQFESGADNIAIEHGYKKQLHESICFKLTSPDVNEAYKRRLKKFYSAQRCERNKTF